MNYNLLLLCAKYDDEKKGPEIEIERKSKNHVLNKLCLKTSKQSIHTYIYIQHITVGSMLYIKNKDAFREDIY